MKRNIVPLCEVLNLKRGYDLPQYARGDGNIPVVSSSGITGRHLEAKVAGPGVITGRYGTLGEVFFVEEPYWPLNTALYVQDFKGNHPHYIFYFLKWVLGKTQSSKAAVPGINRNDLHARNVYFASNMQEQLAIASILSAYDDLIENNRRRIQLLEESARQLYKEWFVRLRFPGHEHVKVVDGVPEGWERKSAWNVVQILSGGTPKTNIADYWNGDIPFFTPRDAVDTAYAFVTEKTLTETGLKKCASQLFEKDTIFITARGTVGKINLAQTKMAMNQSCYALKALYPLNQLFGYFALTEEVRQFKAKAVGSVFDAIIKDTFKHITLLIPSCVIVEQFTEYASNVLRQIDILSAQNRKLAQARDLLLPKLMSGEVAV